MSATASTSKVPTSPLAFTAPPQVVADLVAARDRSQPEDAWQDATESSLEWLLSLRPSSTGGASNKGKGKAKDCSEVVHWFCGRDGAEACWESAMFLIRLVAFKAEGEVGKWREQFET